jgi:hypothetical protein
MRPSFPNTTYLSIAILVFCLNSALADYHYVSPNGSDQYPYSSWGTAAHIIDSAIYAASAFDTIYIAAGEYNQIVYQRDQDTCLTFIGAGVDSTKVWTDQNVQQWFAVDKTVVDSIWFEHSFDQVSFGVRRFGANIMVQHCKFTNHTPGLMGYAIMAWGEIGIVENCEFYDKYIILDALYPEVLVFRNNYMNSRNHKVILGDWHWGIIENNILAATGGVPYFSEPTNYADSTIFQNNYLDHMVEGFNASAPLSSRVENNTTRISVSASAVFYNQGDPGYVSFINNALTESEYGINASNAGAESLHIAYNGFWGNSRSNLFISRWDHVDTLSNINDFPMYANPDSFDVHLQAYSLFIDAGDPNILDVDGTRSDIGVFGGPGGSSYQYQDLPPRKPDSLAYRISEDSLIITWRMNNEADFWRYMINRDTVSGFTPWAGNIVSEPDSNLFIDFNWDSSHNYYYKIAAYDNQHNLSPYSDELAVNIVRINDNPGVETPSITAIESNYPNPFNSSTTIIYSVANLGPIPAQINIDIYDIQGRIVRSLLDNREEVGRHTITWDGKDDDNRDLSSGIYFARITQWKVDYLSRSQKLLLVR